MNALAERYAADGVGAIFVYTNEAHPGERYPHHTSFAQKLAQARALREEVGVSRPILVDALDGACHRAYGGMPNMTWIFLPGGMPVYKADWTDTASVASALDYCLTLVGRRQAGERLAAFHVERLDFRARDLARIRALLADNGPKALREFEAFGR